MSRSLRLLNRFSGLLVSVSLSFVSLRYRGKSDDLSKSESISESSDISISSDFSFISVIVVLNSVRILESNRFSL